MNQLNWLLRAKQWAANPPSWQRVVLIFTVIALCLAVAGFERLFGWPEWLTVEKLSAKP